MATWTIVSDKVAGDPARAVDYNAVKENITALAEGASGAPKIQGSALDDAIITSQKIADSSAGNTIIGGSLEERRTTNTSPTKLKEFIVLRDGEYRITFDIKSSNITQSESAASARVYRNGSAVGTTKSQVLDWSSQSDDVSGWSAGDRLQLYVWHNGIDTDGYIRNVYIKSSDPVTAAPTTLDVDEI